MKTFLYKIGRPLFTAVIKLYYNPKIVHAERIPKEGAAVIAGNHKHALDPILVGVCTKRVLHSLAKKELHDGRFGAFFHAAGTIPVDLHASENRAALQTAVEYLKQGALIGVSPEAKRNFTNEILLPFKFGAVSMAQKANCVIVPYAITGSYQFRSKDLKITFGAPLTVSEMPLAQANEQLFCTVKDMLEEERKSHEKRTAGAS